MGILLLAAASTESAREEYDGGRRHRNILGRCVSDVGRIKITSLEVHPLESLGLTPLCLVVERDNCGIRDGVERTRALVFRYYYAVSSGNRYVIFWAPPQAFIDQTDWKTFKMLLH